MNRPLTEAEKEFANGALHRFAIAPARSDDEVEQAYEHYLDELFESRIIRTDSGLEVLDDLALVTSGKALSDDVEALVDCSPRHLRRVCEALRRRDFDAQHSSEHCNVFDELSRRAD